MRATDLILEETGGKFITVDGISNGLMKVRATPLQLNG